MRMIKYKDYVNQFEDSLCEYRINWYERRCDFVKDQTFNFLFIFEMLFERYMDDDIIIKWDMKK